MITERIGDATARGYGYVLTASLLGTWYLGQANAVKPRIEGLTSAVGISSRESAAETCGLILTIFGCFDPKCTDQVATASKAMPRDLVGLRWEEIIIAIASLATS
jgi:hypothetical protein